MSKLSKALNRALGIPEVRLVKRSTIEKEVNDLRDDFLDYCEKRGVDPAVAALLWIWASEQVLDLF